MLRVCTRCQKAHSTPQAFLLICATCTRAWHHRCHIPPIEDEELIERVSATNRAAPGGLADWTCRRCSRAAAAKAAAMTASGSSSAAAPPYASAPAANHVPTSAVSPAPILDLAHGHRPAFAPAIAPTVSIAKQPQRSLEPSHDPPRPATQLTTLPPPEARPPPNTRLPPNMLPLRQTRLHLNSQFIAKERIDGKTAQQLPEHREDVQASPAPQAAPPVPALPAVYTPAAPVTAVSASPVHTFPAPTSTMSAQSSHDQITPTLILTNPATPASPDTLFLTRGARKLVQNLPSPSDILSPPDPALVATSTLPQPFATPISKSPLPPHILPSATLPARTALAPTPITPAPTQAPIFAPTPVNDGNAVDDAMDIDSPPARASLARAAPPPAALLPALLRARYADAWPARPLVRAGNRPPPPPPPADEFFLGAWVRHARAAA